MVLSSLLPVLLVVIGLTSLFVYRHLADLEEALEQRGSALARQAAVTAEFSLFTGNSEFLQAMALGVLRTDADVVGVAVTDVSGQIVAQAGVVERAHWPSLELRQEAGDSVRIAHGAAGDVIASPVLQRTLAVDDAYSGTELAVSSRESKVLGHVILELSRQRVLQDRQRLILIALITGLIGGLLGGALALRIARGISRPVLEATDVVERIGLGDLTARMNEQHAGHLTPLARGINAMANQVALTQDDLGLQIQAATAELMVQRDTAEQATAAKSRFLAAASHDLRQPLHALGLFVSRLAKMPWNGEQQLLIHHVETSVGTLQEMLDTLLDISRLESGTYRTEMQTFDVTSILQRLVTELAPAAYEKRVVLRVRFRPLWTQSDPRLVERIVLNLLSNAIRHSEQGRVLLACRALGDKLRIQVWDTGTGIPPAMHAAVFDEYVQIGNEERDRTKGLGLGLSICQRMADVLGTRINLRSIPGRGSVFWIDLPLHSPQHVDKPPAEPESGSLAGTILVVDDDALCRDSTASILTGWGAEVITAMGAEQALAVAARLHKAGAAPQVAICDLRLPGRMDGMDLALELRKTYPSMKIVLVTADVSPAVQAVARRSGFPILKKPVAPARLRATLLSLLQA
jgi:signal transduction histidine kinase